LVGKWKVIAVYNIAKDFFSTKSELLIRDEEGNLRRFTVIDAPVHVVEKILANRMVEINNGNKEISIEDIKIVG